MEQGLITFFDVSECGFYRAQAIPDGNGKRQNVYVNGTIEEALNHVTEWVKERVFSETIPWSIEEDISRTKIYIKDVGQDLATGDQLIVFCKALTNDKGQLSGFVEDAKVGSDDGSVIQVEKNAGGKKLVYGLPMYFWFLPNENLIASIKFPNSLVDTQNMCLYIKRCIDNYINLPNKVVHNNRQFNHFAKKELDIKSVFYRSPCGTFSTRFTMDTKLKELTAEDISPSLLAPNITHLVVREVISSEREIENIGLFNLWNRLTNKAKTVRAEKFVEIVEEIAVTPEELIKILEVYKQENLENSLWSDVGFRTNNDDTTKWFSSYVDRRHITLDPKQKVDQSFYPASILLNSLSDQREGLLNFTGKAASRDVKTA